MALMRSFQPDRYRVTRAPAAGHILRQYTPFAQVVDVAVAVSWEHLASFAHLEDVSVPSKPSSRRLTNTYGTVGSMGPITQLTRCKPLLQNSIHRKPHRAPHCAD
jgi:hypothetical protein